MKLIEKGAAPGRFKTGQAQRLFCHILVYQTFTSGINAHGSDFVQRLRGKHVFLTLSGQARLENHKHKQGNVRYIIYSLLIYYGHGCTSSILPIAYDSTVDFNQASEKESRADFGWMNNLVKICLHNYFL